MDYYRGLIGLRAAFPRLGALDKASPAAIEFFPLEQPLVGWRLPAQWGDGAAWSALCVYYNPTETAQVVTLPGGSWKLLSDGISSSLWRGSSRICTCLLYTSGTCNAADPYARSAGVNGVRSMIFDPARVDPQGWERDVRPVIPPARRSVWEVSVRDFSQDPASGVHTAWRGKFLAFTQQGTTLSSDGIHPTCLNYLKRLGVSYVQLMPIFDFGSVDESRPLTRQYNWGYDPTNFNVPEGSYSTCLLYTSRCV